MSNRTFLSELGDLLQKPLPGLLAQRKMEPSHRPQMLLLDSQVKPRQSGVLVLLYPKEQQWHVVFIHRSVYPGTHSGQISFPGGKYEKYDRSLVDTALREAHEEIGVSLDSVEILGMLSSLYIPPSHFCVQPVVGIVKETPLFIIDTYEVQSVIEVPLSHFYHEEVIKTFQWEADGRPIVAPYYDLFGYKLWGATAMIMSELIELIGATSFSEELKKEGIKKPGENLRQA